MLDSVDITYDGIEITVKGDFIPYKEGKTQGDPESCYPSEGGYVEGYEILVGGYDITDILRGNVESNIREAAFEKWSEK